MDPDTCFDELIAALDARDWPAAEERASALLDWLRKDGFAPNRPPLPDPWAGKPRLQTAYIERLRNTLMLIRERQRAAVAP